MAEAGTVSVPVEAQTDGVPEAIQQAIDSVTGDVQVDVEAVTDAAQAEIDSLTADPITAEVDAATDAAQAEIDALDGGTVTEQVEADTSDAESSISSLADEAAASGGSISDLGGSISDAGGELDSFAGAALGSSGALTGMGLAGGGAAAAFGFLVDKASEAQTVTAQTDALLESAGGRAGITASQIEDLGMKVEGYSGFSHVAVDEGQNLLLMFDNVSSKAAVQAGVFQRTTELGADLARVTGSDVTSAIRNLGRAVDDPVKGLGRLRRAGIQLTDSQIAEITTLQQSGDLLGAQNALLDDVSRKVDGVAEAYGQTFSGQVDIAKEKLSDLAETGGSQVLPLLTNLTVAASGLADALGRVGVSAADAHNGFDVLEATGLGALGRLARAAKDMNLDAFGSGIENTAGSAVAAAIDPTIGLGTAAEQAATQVSDLTRQIQAYEQQVFGITNAEDAFIRAQFAVLDSLAQGGAAITGNTMAALNNRQALQGLVSTTGQRVAQLRSQGASETQVAGAQRQAIGVINTMADRYGWTRAQTQRYTDAILHIPHGAATNIVVNGLGQAITGIGQMLNTLEALNSRTFTAHINAITNAPLFASGTESAPRGMAWVGEQGPELIALGGGERIFSHPESMRIADTPSAAPARPRRGGGYQPVIIKLNEIELGRALIPVLNDLEAAIG